METMNVTFDELSTMAFEQRSSKPELQGMTSGHINSRLDLTYATQLSDATRTALIAPATLNLQTLNASITNAESALTPTNSSIEALAIPNTS
ncbi:hypothetical protein Tco_1392677 [Tanacetum coccineum]